MEPKSIMDEMLQGTQEELKQARETIAQLTADRDHWKARAEELQKEQEEEHGRWQKAIYEVLLKYAPDNKIDGAGCDSGDPLDFTITEIHQALSHVQTERDSLKQRVEKVEKDFSIACSSRDSEARLACDLRTSQDTIIERCAQAVQAQYPEAAKILRSHADGISGEDWGELKRENTSLKQRAAKVMEVWDRNCSRVFESMGDDNPRADAISEAIDELREGLKK